ncbi:MAG: polysaccharide biosynthesis protein, partial [Candidatus Micrarchaeota archaeon]
TRFIISHDQAADLVFFALQNGIGGEVFVPKLPAFKLPDLANVLKKHYNSKSATKVIGMRPGEKLDELMVNEYEVSSTYDLEKYMVIISQIDKYQDNAKFAYLKNKKKVSFTQYSSRDAVVSESELEKILKEVGVLNGK